MSFDPLSIGFGFLIGLPAGVALAVFTVLRWGCYIGCLLHPKECRNEHRMDR